MIGPQSCMSTLVRIRKGPRITVQWGMISPSINRGQTRGSLIFRCFLMAVVWEILLVGKECLTSSAWQSFVLLLVLIVSGGIFSGICWTCICLCELGEHPPLESEIYLSFYEYHTSSPPFHCSLNSHYSFG